MLSIAVSRRLTESWGGGNRWQVVVSLVAKRFGSGVKGVTCVLASVTEVTFFFVFVRKQSVGLCVKLVVQFVFTYWRGV